MILVDKVHQLFKGHNLILLPSSQETFSFLGWKLRMSVICLCLLDVQTEAAASGGRVPGDPRQVECAMLQHACSELLKFQEGAWALWLSGAHAVDVVHKGLIQVRLRVPPALWRVSCWAVSPCASVSRSFIRALSQAGPFQSHPPTSKTPQNPEQISVPFIFQVSCYWPGPVSQKLQFTWAIWISAGLSICFP